ncbi:hypothetical protein PGIGA_G00198950, partial [Pangasianodon gigas]|nr:hypothetical protein [Pangasianodon gigas]
MFNCSLVKKVLILPPQSREECLQYSRQLTLDPKTAHQRLQLSDSSRMATDKDIQTYYEYSYVNGYRQKKVKQQEWYEHPESFNKYSQ